MVTNDGTVRDALHPQPQQQEAGPSPLLQEALSFMKNQRQFENENNDDDENNVDWLFRAPPTTNQTTTHAAEPLRNLLIVRMFVMEEKEEPSISLVGGRDGGLQDRLSMWKHMAQVCNEANDLLQQWTTRSQYPWFAGRCWTLGVHDKLPSPPSLERVVMDVINNRREEILQHIPHLCGLVRYGNVSVEDEWVAIALLCNLTLSRDKGKSWAIHVWDFDDGDLLGTEVAPEMRREEEESLGPLSFWIKDGQLWMVPSASSSMSWEEALKSLQTRSKASVAPVRMQQCLKRRLDRYIQRASSSSCSSLSQSPTFVNSFRAAMVLPRRVARWIQQEPQMVSLAIRAYCRHVQNREMRASKLRIPLEDLVVVAVPTSRTLYAMLWTTTPPSMSSRSSLEICRMQQWCEEEVRAAKFGHAVLVGQRLCLGIELWLRSVEKQNAKQRPKTCRRGQIQQWRRLLATPRGDLDDDDDDATNAEWAVSIAPETLHELEQCPVLDCEWLRATFGSTNHSFLPAFMRQMDGNDDDDDDDNEENDAISMTPPHPDQVDNANEWIDDWTKCQSEMMKLWHDADPTNSSVGTSSTSPLRDDATTTRGQDSRAESNAKNTATFTEPPLEAPICIQPRLFVSLLVQALKGPPQRSREKEEVESGKEEDETSMLLKLGDGFFTAEDYEYFLQNGDSDDDDDDDDGDKEDEGEANGGRTDGRTHEGRSFSKEEDKETPRLAMKEIMSAMDHELQDLRQT